MTTIHVLGPLAVRGTTGALCTPPGPKVRKVLGLLAVRVGEGVSLSALADELWHDRPPRSAVTTIRTHVYHLRRALEANAPEVAAALVTEPTGYRLALAREAVDAPVFAAAVSRARLRLARGEAAEAAADLRSALDLWSGPALADVAAGPLLAGHVGHLEELRLDAVQMRIEADLLLGRHRQLVPELRGLVARHPLDEWFHARLIDALHRGGRRGEALRAYHELRHVLDRELGLEPSVELRRLQQRVLLGGRVA